MTYTISYEPSVEKTLRKTENQFRPAIESAIKALATDPFPHGSTKLAGSSGNYRIRVGVFRIIYSVNNAALVIRIIEINHRKDIYRKR